MTLSEESLQTLQDGLQGLLQRRTQLMQALQETERMIAYQQGAVELMQQLLAKPTQVEPPAT